MSASPRPEQRPELTTPGLDLSYLRGAAQPRMSRRGLLRGAAGVAGGGAMAAFLSACGIKGTQQGAAAANQIDWTSWWASKKLNHHFNFDNWAAYIDVDSHGHYPTLEKFTKDTGISVKYDDAAVTDTATYYGKISPALSAGKSPGADIFVMTNGWEFTELVNNGWVAQLDHSRMPNFLKNALPYAASPAYDFDALHSAVWQSGYTGIAYHEDLLPDGVTISGWKDLANPALKDKVTYFADLDEFSIIGLVSQGLPVESATPDDWQKAADWFKQNLLPNTRKFFDQGYLDAFKSKQMPVTQAWSGDILAIMGDFPHMKFVFPEEGFLSWHDNMMIPITAQNPLDALTWMDYYYQVPIASAIEDYIWYVSPVDGVRDYIGKVLKDTDYADSDLAFPPASVMAKKHEAHVFKDRSEYDVYTSIFQPLVQG